VFERAKKCEAGRIVQMAVEIDMTPMIVLRQNPNAARLGWPLVGCGKRLNATNRPSS
jgi:hypothetical protein